MVWILRALLRRGTGERGGLEVLLQCVPVLSAFVFDTGLAIGGRLGILSSGMFVAGDDGIGM